MTGRLSLAKKLRKSIGRLLPSSVKRRMWTEQWYVGEFLQRGLTTLGFRHSESRLLDASQRHWNERNGAHWKTESHWRGSRVFSEGDLWWLIGRRHLTMFERGARALAFERPWGRIMEWGCGGGANAVQFAPQAQEFTGLDVSSESLAECDRQVSACCSTPFHPVIIDVAHPEEALGKVETRCDVFLCFYVFELLPTPEYGERVVHIAGRLLTPGGLALIQIKYHEGEFWSRPRRRSYGARPSAMTSYRIPEFWELVKRHGFIPELIELVPRNELDERYAYFLLSKQTPDGSMSTSNRN